jgi:hypothetical protein
LASERDLNYDKSKNEDLIANDIKTNEHNHEDLKMKDIIKIVNDSIKDESMNLHTFTINPFRINKINDKKKISTHKKTRYCRGQKYNYPKPPTEDENTEDLSYYNQK